MQPGGSLTFLFPASLFAKATIFAVGGDPRALVWRNLRVRVPVNFALFNQQLQRLPPAPTFSRRQAHARSKWIARSAAVF